MVIKGFVTCSISDGLLTFKLVFVDKTRDIMSELIVFVVGGRGLVTKKTLCHTTIMFCPINNFSRKRSNNNNNGKHINEIHSKCKNVRKLQNVRSSKETRILIG